MKFTALRNDGHGSSHAPVTLEEVQRFPLGQLQFDNLHSLESRKVEDFGKLKLQTRWTHYVMLQGREVYRFSSSMNCNIEEEDIPATEEQCIEIVNKTHEDLRSQWEIHRKEEVNFFPSLSPLTTEQNPPFLSHLIQTLNGEQDQMTATE